VSVAEQVCFTSDAFGVEVKQYKSRSGQQRVEIRFRDSDERERYLLLDLSQAQTLGEYLAALEAKED
jgi:hypothetical protein